MEPSEETGRIRDALRAAGPLSQVEIAARTGVDPAAIAAWVAAEAEAGRLRRHPRSDTYELETP